MRGRGQTERVYSGMRCPIKYWDRGANQNTLLTFDPVNLCIAGEGDYFLQKEKVPLFWSNNHGLGCLSGHCLFQNNSYNGCECLNGQCWGWSLRVTNGCWQRALTPGSRCAHTDNRLVWDVHCVTTHPQLRGEHLGLVSLESSLSTALSQLSITSGGHHPLTTAANSTNSTNNTAQDWLQDLKCLNIGLVGIICEVVPSASVDLNNYLCTNNQIFSLKQVPIQMFRRNMRSG